MNEPAATGFRSPQLHAQELSRLLIVDVQAKLTPHIFNAEDVVANCETLIRGAQILDVPVSVTEQYPKGLGSTVESLAALLPEPIEKLRFSAFESLGWGEAAEDESARDQIIVAGMEAHVCVLQTALDLVAHGYRVTVPADAVGSRSERDYEIALRRMADCGVTIATTESILFEWTETAGTAEFKQISRLVK